MSKLQFNSMLMVEKEGDLSILPKGKISNQGGYDPEQGTKPTPIRADRDLEFSSSRYVPWGWDNMYPNFVRSKLEKSTIAMSTIRILTAMMYGRLIYFRERDVEGKPIEINSPGIETFIQRNRLKKYFQQQIIDYRFYANTFPEMILTKDKTKIVRLVHQDAYFSRLSRQNPKSLRVEFVGRSANWPDPASEDLKWIPLIDDCDPFGFIDKVRASKFAWWCFYPSPGRTYYKVSPWAGLFRDKGWLDVANDIPDIISAMHKNQITIKYHIKIPETYWMTMYKDWESYTHEKRMELYNNKVKEMNTFLQGKGNQFKSFTTMFGVDPITKAAYPDWKIEAIEDKTKKDEYIPNSNAADAQIVQTLGLDPSNIGLQNPGGNMGGGSGSDKRVAFINGIALNTIDQEILLEPLDFITEYNGILDEEWRGLKWAFAHTIPGRLDQNPSGTNQTV